MNILAAQNLALMPSFLDPVHLLNSFGTWFLIGLLIIVFIESGLLFPFLPGDSLLFTAGLVAAAGSGTDHDGVHGFAPLWQLLIFVPIAAILGDQVGYFIGRRGGSALFKPDARLFKTAYVDEAHAFFEKHGPVTIFLGRFVPIVRTFTPLVAGASKMKYGTFIGFNVLGGVVWGAGVTLLGYWLGNISFIRAHIDMIFIVIVLVSVLPIIFEVGKRLIASRRNETTAPQPADLPD